MSESARSRSGALAKLVLTIVLAGGLVAAVLLPWVGGTGLVARDSTSLLDALPVELTDQTLNGNTTVVAADGQLITQFYENNRAPVTPDQVSEVMKQALVDIEDSRFYEHNGLDVQGTARAALTNLAAGGEIREGGSTLTQQLVKQTLAQTAETREEQEAATEQSVGRKLREVRLALALEETYSKDEILARYLNIAYFGYSAYGIQAAAQTYFSVNAIDLTLPQATVLAGLVQSPKFDPINYPEQASTRRNQVLNRMHDLGHITDQELADVSASPIPIVEGAKPPNGCAQAVIGGFFCDYLTGYLTNTLGMSMSQLNNGGYTIQTTLRPDVQTAGDAAVLNTVGLENELIGVFDVVEPGTGHVLGMSVNRRFGCDAADPTCESVNFAVTPSKGSGSTFKTFVAAAALQAGLPASHTITTGDPYTSRIYKTYDEGRRVPYSVGNAGNYAATLTMTQALYRSSNTYFLALEDALGSVRPAVEMAETLGMGFDAPNQKTAAYWKDGNLGSFPYSPEPVSPLELSTAYATIAASGVRCDPNPVLAITTTSTGQPLLGDDGQPVVTGDRCSQVIAPGIANTLNQMMRKDVEPGNPGATGLRAYVPGHQITGKTGTVQNNDSVTFVGSTPEYTGTVMVFRPLGIGSVGGFGGNKPAVIWNDAMTPILENQATAEFPPADPAYAGAGVDAAPVGPRPTNDDDDDRRSNPRGNGGGATSSPTPAPTPPATESAPPAGDPVDPPDDEDDED